MPERIIDVNAYEQNKDDYTKYAIFVCRRRVTPDYKDGMKLIHRRILYTAYKISGATSFATKTKSADIVGSCMGKFHPHGDAAIYGAMRPLINDFEIKMPLLGKQGNLGSLHGDDMAAPRYTESFLSKFAMEYIMDELIQCPEVVDWVETYDGRNKEPEYLPCKVPLLLVNGTFGIGVGLKVEMPSHNLSEVIDATIKLIHNPAAQVVLIPDMCQACEIIETDFKSISNHGNGNFKVRGVIEMIPEMKDGEYKGRPALLVKSLPNLVFLAQIIETVEKLIKENKLVNVITDEDRSSEGHLEYYIIFKKGTDLNYAREVLYANTELQKTCRVNFEVLDGYKPLRMSYKSYLLAFLEFRKNIKFRLYCNKMQTIQTRIHQIDTYIKVLQSGDIENIIAKIRKQKTIDDTELIEYFIKKLHITDLQAKFLLEADLKMLSAGYLNKYIEEFNKLSIEKDRIFNAISDDSIILADIEAELLECKAKYGSKRLCKVISVGESNNIPAGEFKVVVTENNFIKKVPLNDTIGYFRNDSPKAVIKADNTQNILIFDAMGKVFKLPVHKIPFSDKNSPGTDIRTISKNITSTIMTVMYEPTIQYFAEKIDKYHMVVLTKAGYIKKMDLEDFLSVPASGLAYSKLDEGDYIISAMIAGANSDIIIYSDSKALRVNMTEIPSLLRQARGVKSMSSSPVDGLSIIGKDTTDIVVVTESGKFNRFMPEALPRSSRAKAGSTVIKLGKTDKIKTIYGINSSDSIRVIINSGKVDVPVSSIPISSSIGSGEKLINQKDGPIIKCMVLRNM